MKRRAFFGVMGGAAVAGPQMAKQAASTLAAGLDSLSLKTPLDVGYTKAALNGVGGIGGGYDAVGEARAALAKLIGITAAQRAKAKRETHVGSLDPDIESYRSFSLAFKIDMQKERNVNARIEQSRTMWDRIANNLNRFGDDDDFLPI